MKSAVLLKYRTLKCAKQMLRRIAQEKSAHVRQCTEYLGAELHDPREHDLGLDGCAGVLLVFTGPDRAQAAHRMHLKIVAAHARGLTSFPHPGVQQHHGYTARLEKLLLHDCARHNPVGGGRDHVVVRRYGMSVLVLLKDGQFGEYNPDDVEVLSMSDAIPRAKMERQRYIAKYGGVRGMEFLAQEINLEGVTK